MIKMVNRPQLFIVVAVIGIDDATSSHAFVIHVLNDWYVGGEGMGP